MSNEPLDPDLAAFEAELSVLRPVASRMDRDQLMFLAGQAAATGRRKARGALGLWQAATAASLLAAAAFAGLWTTGGKTVFVDRVASAVTNEPSLLVGEALPGLASGCEYLKLRNLVLTEGVDALPAPKSAGESRTPRSERGLRPGGDIEPLLGG